jgi:3-hydroxyisobutyrate dehydrogenase-like beta-hydroxyacid dehydrogenase
MTTVAVVGLGTMGSRIARRLLDAGYDLVVWNRSPDRAAPLADLGASVAQTPAEATRRADVVITMVSDPRALKDVTEGPDGVAAGAGASTTVIQMSTVGIEPVRRLASILPAEAALLDAPVLGSIAEVETGSLKIFVGGPLALVERWTPLLSVLGSPIHVGVVGAGSAAKLVANSTLFGVLGVLGEALLLARALGLPDDVAFEVLAATPLAAQAERRRPSVEAGEYPTRFSLSLARKDAGLVTDAGANLRLAEAALAWLEEAEAAGLGELDYSALLGYMLGYPFTS